MALRPSAASRNLRDLDSHEQKLPPPEDSLIKILHWVIHFAVRVLAVLMTLVILWGVADVVHVLYQKLMVQPFLLLTVNDILAVFGAFLSVLIFFSTSPFISNMTCYRSKWLSPRL